MLIDTLNDTQQYLKSTLLECLDEQGLTSSYKTVQRREKAGIEVYNNITRDPVSGYRMYTGKQIRDIVEYEKQRKSKTSK